MALRSSTTISERPARAKANLAAITLAIVVLGLLAQAATVYLIDPDGLYREDRASLTGSGMWDEMLVARYGRGDAVMLGTSMSERTYYDDFSRLAGIKVLNLAGVTNLLSEQARLLTFALDRRPLRTVFWEMSVNLRDPLGLKEQFPDYALDDWVGNDWRYLLSGKAFRRAVAAWLENRHGAPGDFDSTARSWPADDYNASKPASARQGLANAWAKSRLFAKVPEPVIREAMRSRVAPIVASHPEVRFVFFFPPMGIYGLQEADRRLRVVGLDQPRFNAILVDELSRFPNVEIFDFQRRELVTDMAEYSDAIHYSERMNNRLAKAFATGAYRLAGRDYSANAAALAQMIATFDEDGKR